MKPNFNYIQPTEEQMKRMQHFRERFANLCDEIIDLVPNGRGRSTTFTKLEEASFWLNKAITLNDGSLTGGIAGQVNFSSPNIQRGVCRGICKHQDVNQSSCGEGEAKE